MTGKTYYDRYGRVILPGDDVVIKTRHGVFGLVISPDDHILLTSPPHVALHYEIPGGGVEPGEAELEALLREIYEETGVTFSELRHGHIYEQTIGFYAEDNDAFWDYHQTFYEVRLPEQPRDFFTQLRSNPEGGLARWCRMAELDTLPIQEMHKPAINALLRPKRSLASAIGVC
jgi:8-oxo-dGTP pyrophosphatase MutT (NUDIX family)